MRFGSLPRLSVCLALPAMLLLSLCSVGGAVSSRPQLPAEIGDELDVSSAGLAAQFSAPAAELTDEDGEQEEAVSAGGDTHMGTIVSMVVTDYAFYTGSARYPSLRPPRSLGLA